MLSLWLYLWLASYSSQIWRGWGGGGVPTSMVEDKTRGAITKTALTTFDKSDTHFEGG